MIYTDAEQINDAVEAYLDGAMGEDSRVSILGGAGVVGDAVEASLKEKLDIL